MGLVISDLFMELPMVIAKLVLLFLALICYVVMWFNYYRKVNVSPFFFCYKKTFFFSVMKITCIIFEIILIFSLMGSCSQCLSSFLYKEFC